jgi:RND family efflux transporter MFP subunit
MKRSLIFTLQKGLYMSAIMRMDETELQSSSRTLQALGMIAVIVAATIGVALFLMALAGCFYPKVAAAEGRTSQVVAARTMLADVRLIHKPRYETAVGTIKAVHESAVASRLLARVVDVNVKAGQAVQRDDILLRLDDADLRARHQQAEAALAAAKTNLEQAQLEHNRAARLVKTQTIAQEEFERAAAKVRTTESDVKRHEQAVHESKVFLDYATVRAPLTGIVIDKKVEVGDTVIPGQTLIALFNPDKMQMLASVRESLALKLRVGQKLPARIDSLGHEGEATISEIVPEAQAASRSFIVKVAGPCPPGVYSGMFGRIYIPLQEEQITVVPAAAIKRVGQLEIVQVVEGETLRRRNIQTGRSIGADLEVLAGLRPGEKVALAARATEGRP